MAVPAAVELVDLALKATTAYERPDLGARLQATRKRLADPDVRVLVVGEFKQGKSQLVNALVNAPVCPVDDDIATAVPTVVRTPRPPPSPWSGRARRAPSRPERTEVPAAQLAEYVSEAGKPANRAGLSYAEVGLPRKLLAGGLVLVDTPGVGGLGSAHGAATMSALPSADAVLLVSDAAQEYTGPELEFLAAAMKLCPNVGCVLTKTDLYPHWRRIAELDRGHLRDAGIRRRDLPGVLDAAAARGARPRTQAMLDESGFRELVEFLLRRVVARADDLDRRSTSQDVLAVAEQLGAGMKAELAVQENPERLDALVAELTRAKARADELKQRSSRWQITLNDGVADLQSDIEYDLRDRLRSIGREAEQLIDDADPAEIWDQFAEWFHQQVSSAASANFVWAAERARWLAAQVAEHFAEGAEVAAARPALRPTRAWPRKVNPLEQPEAEKFGIGSKLLHRLARRLRRHADGRHGHHGGRARPAQPALARRRRAARRQDRAGREEAHAATPAGRRQAGGAQAHRRGDLPGRQGLPGHAAAHPAPAARPLQRAGRGGQHLDRGLGGGGAERGQDHRRRPGAPDPRPQGRAGPDRRAGRAGPQAGGRRARPRRRAAR